MDRRLSVVRPLSIRGHISKTKRDRPIVSIEYYLEVGTAETRISLQGGVWGRILYDWLDMEIINKKVKLMNVRSRGY